MPKQGKDFELGVVRGLLTPDADRVNITPTGQQALSDAGAVNLTTYVTKWTTTGAAAGTLADGLVPGQVKKILMVADAGDGTLTPANFSDGTTITFADAGDFVILQWDGENWVLVESGNSVDGVSAPVVA